MNEVKSMLQFLRKGEIISNSFLLRKRYSQETIDFAIESGFIIEVDNTLSTDMIFGDIKYMITDLGIEFRDSKIG